MVDQTEDGDRSENGRLNNTRRQFVAGTAGTLGGLALGTGFVAPSLAQDDGDGDGPIQNEFEDDVAILNFALTLEYLEARFYQEGLDNIGEDGLCNCDVLSEGSALAERAFDELRTIQAHEEAHIETLTGAIEELGGEPIEEPTFDFGLAVEYPMAFLATAAQLEDIGVSAYAGAAPFIANEDLVAPALGIHSVEARHASFLRTLSNETGFPDASDQPRSRSEVLELAGGFIVEDGEEPAEEPIADDGLGNETDDGLGNETDDGTTNETAGGAGNDTGT